MLAIALVAAGQSPVQHVTQGDLEVFTGPYSSFPDNPDGVIGFFPDSQRVYGLSVVVINADPMPCAAYRVQVDLTLENGDVIHVDQSFRVTWGNWQAAWFIVQPDLKKPPVSIAHLVITKQREDVPVEIPLAVPETEAR